MALTRLVVARIGRAHGLRGEVTIQVHTDVPQARFVPGAVLFSRAGNRGRVTGGAATSGNATASNPGSLTLRSVRDHNGTLLLGFEEIADRTAAETLRGVVLEVDIDTEATIHGRPDGSSDGSRGGPGGADPGAEDDAWYDHQLIGLRVLDPAGAELGRVVGVEHLPAQDLLEVARGDGERRLVPFVTAMVPTVDVAAGLVVVDGPPGLIDDLPDDLSDDLDHLSEP